VGMIAFVFRDTHSSTLSTLRQYVSLSISAKTGVAPVSTTAFAAPTNVNEGRITRHRDQHLRQATRRVTPLSRSLPLWRALPRQTWQSFFQTLEPSPIPPYRSGFTAQDFDSCINLFFSKKWLVDPDQFRNSSVGPGFQQLALCA